MVGALGPSVEAGRTVTVRALAPGDYESTNQLRAGLWGWISLILFVLAGLCSLMGPVGDLPLFGYVATMCLLGALSCLAPMCIKALGSRHLRPRKQDDGRRREPPAYRGRSGGASSGPECGDGVGVNGGIVDHDWCGRHGSEFP